MYYGWSPVGNYAINDKGLSFICQSIYRRSQRSETDWYTDDMEQAKNEVLYSLSRNSDLSQVLNKFILPN